MCRTENNRTKTDTTNMSETFLTLCIDKKCPSRNSCVRWAAKPGPAPSYADFNRADGAAQCTDGFWPMMGTTLQNPIDKQDAEQV
jgi:hypothetical protein